jgi:hypothetical protein
MKRIQIPMRICMLLFCACALAAMLSVETALGFQVELKVDEPAGVGRAGAPVTAGVPFPRGTIYSDQDVQIAGVPAQFKALSTWPDNSVRWLLCDFQADVPAYGSATYYLTDGSGDATGTPLTATEDADSIVVRTGPMKFVVSKTNFNLFQRLWLDLDEDGSFEPDEEMISAHAQDGAIVTDDLDQQFYSAEDGNVSVTLEESGPMRLAILAEGWHRDGGGQRMLDFTIRIQAYANKNYVRVFYTFYNRQSTAITGHLDVKDISLRSHINLQGSASYAFGGSGGAVHSGSLSGTESAYIYGYGTCTPGDLHYIIGGGGGGSGGKARGWADISDSRWGLTTGIRQFWQHHPKGIQVQADGEIWVRLLPLYYDSFPINPGDPRTAADRIYCGAAKTHEMLYYFHPGGATEAGSEDLALSFEEPLFAVAPPDWYTSTEALGKILPQDLSLIKPEYRSLVQNWEDHIENMYNVIVGNRENSPWSGKNEYGMWNYGDSWQGEWSNLHYDAPYSLYTQFTRTGQLKWFDLANDQCRHYRDVDIVHHMGNQEPGSLKEASVGAARGRPNEYHNLGIDDQGYTVLKGPGLILHYFLTGDRQSLHGGKLQADFVRNSALRYHQDLVLYDARFLGQALRAMLAYYEASGDETYLNNGVYHLGDMDGSQKASAYTLARKITEYQSISPQYPDVWSIWQHIGCDCDDGFRCWHYDGTCVGSSWQSGIAWEALIYYYSVTEDPVARDDILRGVNWMTYKSDLWTDLYGGYFRGYEPAHPEPGGVSLAGMYIGVMGFAFAETENIDYLDRAVSALHVSLEYGSATIDPKLFAQKTRTVPHFFYYLSEEYGIQDSIPPNPPTGLSPAGVTEHSISLVWTPPSPASDGDGAHRYDLYRDGVPIGTSQMAQYEDTGLAENTPYDYAVYSIDNAGNQSLTAATGTFSTLADDDPPTITAATAFDPMHVTVQYSEPVEQLSATDIDNYSIDNGVSVSQATLGGDLMTVTLTTSDHLEGITYTLTVNDVRDRADNPNTIAPNSTIGYQLVSELIISNLNRTAYLMAELVEGDEHYVDRAYVIEDIPSAYEGLLWIRTANDDKNDPSEEFLTFTVNQNVTVYVGYDHLVSMPDWITDHYTYTGDAIGVSDLGAGSSMEIWARDVPAGGVIMGGNMASGASGTSLMYIVLLRGQGGGDTVAPDISQVTAGNISGTSATIQWSTDEPSDSQVEYGWTQAYGSSTPVETDLVTQHSISLLGLSPQTLYHYRVRSADAFGNAAHSPDHTFQTTDGGDATPPQISSVEASSVSDTAATISWLTDELSDSQVEYGPDANYGLISPLDTALALSHQVIISLAPGKGQSASPKVIRAELEPAAQPADRDRSGQPGAVSGKGASDEVVWHFRVLSRDAFDNLAVSEDDSFLVEDTTEPLISNLQILSVTDSSAQVSWETDELANASLGYGLQEGDYQWSVEDTTLALTHQFPLDGLIAATAYHLQARSEDQAGNVAIAPDTTLVTRPPLPGQPGTPQHHDD